MNFYEINSYGSDGIRRKLCDGMQSSEANIR